MKRRPRERDLENVFSVDFTTTDHELLLLIVVDDDDDENEP